MPLSHDAALLPRPSSSEALTASSAVSLMLATAQEGATGLQATVDLVIGLGFDIRDVASDPTTVFAGTEPRQGIALEAGAVIGMHSSAASGQRLVSLADIATDVASIFAAADVADVDVPLPRDSETWTRIFTSSLGDASATPESRAGVLAVVLASPQFSSPEWPLGAPGALDDPTIRYMSPVAHSLLLHRLTVDLAVGVPLLAGMDPVEARDGIFPVPAPPTAAVARPCDLGSLGSAIGDLSATVATSGIFGAGVWEQFTKHIKEGDPPNFAKNYMKAAPYINGLLAFIKLVSVAFMFESRVGLASGSALQRTQHADEDGDQAEVEAHFWMKPVSLEWANCIRMVLNALLLDFDLPAAGPLANLSVVGGLWPNGDRVAFCRPGTAGDCDPTNVVDGLFTDTDGKVRMTMTGRAQGVGLSPAAVPTAWSAHVEVFIDLKNSKDAGTVQLIADVLGIVISAATADVFSAVVQTITALVYRYCFSAAGPIPVDDWVEHLTLRYELTKTRSWDYVIAIDEERRYGSEDWTLGGDVPLLADAVAGAYVGEGTLHLDVRTLDEYYQDLVTKSTSHCTSVASADPCRVQVTVTFDSATGTPKVEFTAGQPWDQYWSQLETTCDPASTGGGKHVFWSPASTWASEGGSWRSEGGRGIIAERRRHGYDNKPDEYTALLAGTWSQPVAGTGTGSIGGS